MPGLRWAARVYILTLLFAFIQTAIMPTASAAQSALDEVVVVAARAEQPLSGVASNITFLDQDQLEAVNHTHINELMQRIAGTWISRGNGQEHLTAIRSPVLTGAGSCGAFLMSQDGVALRATGFCNVNELFESTSELAHRIEIIKGPGSAVHGSNALHGVVNILTPRPEASLRQLKLEAGPDDYYRARLTASSDRLRLDVSGTSDGGYKDNSGYDQQKLILKHHSVQDKLTLTTSLSYTNLNQETAGFIQGPEVYKQAALKRSNPNPEAYRDARSYRLITLIQITLPRGSLRLRPYLRSVDMTFLQHFLPGQAIETNGHDSIGLQTLWTSDSRNWRIGLDLEYTQAFLKEYQSNPTPGSDFLMATIPTGRHYDYAVDANTLGLFAQYQREVTDRLTLSADIRQESIHYDYDNKMLTGRTRDDGTVCGFGGCRFNRPASRSDTFSHLSPKVGLIYNFGTDTHAIHQAYTQLSQGFRAPQATELYRLQGGQNLSDIDPVELNAIELGFRGSSTRLDYDVSLFAMKKNNFIFRDTTRRNLDKGKTKHRGIELSFTWRVADTLETRWAFTRANHEYANNPTLALTDLKGNTIDTAPKTLGSATLTYRPTHRTRLELEWVHIGEYFEDPENRHIYEGHDLLHLRARWQASDDLNIFCRITNLGDRDYAERADFGFGNDRYFVGMPRSIYLGATINL